jgi:hypothetical protein
MVEVYELIRHHDVTGASGTGRVAIAVILPDGVAVTHWLTENRSTVVWHTSSRDEALSTLKRIHGHGGHTELRRVGLTSEE